MFHYHLYKETLLIKNDSQERINFYWESSLDFKLTVNVDSELVVKPIEYNRFTKKDIPKRDYIYNYSRVDGLMWL